ncbi:MAG: adenylate/guanylate cyclase domain-containing protein [Kiloniellales bacterium]
MVRRLHSFTGLVLFAYLLTHLINHALGLVSIEALETGRRAFLLLWRNLPASVLLYGALLVHMGLAFWALYRRRSLRMPAWEAGQVILGFSVPPLLVLHILGTRFAHEILGVNDSYVYVLLVYFVFSPLLGIKQAIVVLVAWLHGCIGLHFWLRLKPWYPRLLPLLYALALVIPVVSLLGFYVAGRRVAELARDPSWLGAATARINLADAEGAALVGRIETAVLGGLALLLALTFLARLARRWLRRRRGLVQVTYPDGRRVAVITGTTILEASRGAGIPHAAVCGGRGRCSTCRVRVGAGKEALPPSSEAESRVLTRIGAAPNVRLACQTRPVADIAVTPLLPPAATPRHARASAGQLQGEEREVAILFADLRAFTAMAENKLPYDVVFILNRYFAAMGMAVEEAGGRVDKFIGDGVMALFGIDRGPAIGCRNALGAARRMSERLLEINSALAHDLDQPLRIGIGIHCGPVIVGQMGYGSAISTTAIGDAVNTASRLEAMTKELAVQVIVSEPVAVHAGLDLSAFPHHEIELRGRVSSLVVRAIKNARALPVDVDALPASPRGTSAESR